MNTGWIMLHRKLLENPLARRPAYCHLWVHLLLRACHREVSFIWNERDPFWFANILTPASLRKHFDRLELAMRGSAPAHRETVREMVARMEREGTL